MSSSSESSEEEKVEEAEEDGGREDFRRARHSSRDGRVVSTSAPSVDSFGAAGEAGTTAGGQAVLEDEAEMVIGWLTVVGTGVDDRGCGVAADARIVQSCCKGEMYCEISMTF